MLKSERILEDTRPNENVWSFSRTHTIPNGRSSIERYDFEVAGCLFVYFRRREEGGEDVKQQIAKRISKRAENRLIGIRVVKTKHWTDHSLAPSSLNSAKKENVLSASSCCGCVGLKARDGRIIYLNEIGITEQRARRVRGKSAACYLKKPANNATTHASNSMQASMSKRSIE